MTSISSLTVFAGTDGCTENADEKRDGQHDRVEILVGIERDLVEQRRVDDEIVDGDQDRIAVGRHPCGLRGADIARRAGDVLDQEIAAEVFGQSLRNEAGQAMSVGPPGPNGTMMRTGRVG